MAKVQTVQQKAVKTKKACKKNAKSNTSTNKNSKNYEKPYGGQGR
jgi:hypothetical protein